MKLANLVQFTDSLKGNRKKQLGFYAKIKQEIVYELYTEKTLG